MIGRIAAARLRVLGRAGPGLPWRLQWRAVCASTESELERWLLAGADAPLAVLAGHQRFGHGQQGRPWQAPSGGSGSAPPCPGHPRLTARRPWGWRWRWGWRCSSKRSAWSRA
ncbi:hypothetical protein [Cyanobium sp. ATX-6F1]|uniref:hypothetical protein n=1 Tax=Cyanobium sp. ATX-6F1 TaxID=3137388 RepID=UPI0039BEBBC5